MIEGRGGLGSIYVWAAGRKPVNWPSNLAGNDAGAQDQCNFDGYANMRYAILIGSITSAGGIGKLVLCDQTFRNVLFTIPQEATPSRAQL